jgi:propionate CoA-transferase
MTNLPRVMTARDAVDLIKNGSTVVSSGFVGCGVCEELLSALEERFLETGEPRDLTLLYAAGQGDGDSRGMNHLAHPGMVRRVIGGHWNLAPRLGRMALDNEIEAYCFPQGVIAHMYRDIAAGRPTITHIGLDTFVDPRVDGGKLNSRTTEDLVEVVQIDGREWLHYRHVKPDVAFVRGSTADEHGNISLEREAITIDALPAAQAVHNSGGIVIAQVERLAEGKLPAQTVKVPGIMVDAVVLACPEKHWQTFEVAYNPAFCGEKRVAIDTLPVLPFNERKIVGRRALMEVTEGAIVNIGIGMPDGIAAVAAEEGVSDAMHLTMESGPIGGIPAGGLSFGVASNPEAIISQSSMFDFYDGGGLALAFLGMAETDEQGNVNVSRFGTRIAGAGGFINITQSARKIVYCGTFTAGGLKVSAENDRLRIDQEGKVHKFIKSVSHLTFSAQHALSRGLKVMYVTERAVFELREDGLCLTEIAPGIDLQTQVLDQMDFRPKIADPPRAMDARIFRDQPMGWKILTPDS